MKTILVAISFLFLVAEVAHAVATCTPKNNPNSPMIETEIQNPEATLDFDNLIDLELTPNITLAETVITIRGSPECGLNTNFALGIGVWKNGFAWNPVDPESAGPGSFLGLNSLPGKNEYCEIIFSDPISRFSMRVASDKGAEAGMFIYDESDQEIDCNLFPWVTNSSDNAYAVRGYSSLSRIIKRILFKDSFFAADLLKFSRCPEGTKLEGSLCKATCDFQTCGANAVCAIVNEVATCICWDYYTGNATIGCTPINCTTSSGLCNNFATCSNLDVSPFIACTCNSGYIGDGFGPNGCAPVPAAPVAAPTKKISGCGLTFSAGSFCAIIAITMIL